MKYITLRIKARVQGQTLFRSVIRDRLHIFHNIVWHDLDRYNKVICENKSGFLSLENITVSDRILLLNISKPDVGETSCLYSVIY